MAMNITIVDDEPLIRRLYVHELNKHQDIYISGQFSDGQEFIESLRTHIPDVILLDLYMPGMDGMQILSHITLNAIPIGVLIITMADVEEMILKIYHKGAKGYLHKDTDLDQAYTAIKIAHDGGYYFPKRVSEVIFGHAFHKGADKRQPLSINSIRFTEREITIVNLMNEGFNSKEIAEKLSTSKATIDRVRQDLIHKVGVKNTHGLVFHFHRAGLLT